MAISSWINIPSDSDFSIYNMPWGIAAIHGQDPIPVSRVGDYIISIAAVEAQGWLEDIAFNRAVLTAEVLNPLIREGREVTRMIRKRLQTIVTDDAFQDKAASYLVPVQDCVMHMPVAVGDYTDFYSSIEHATNVGMMFRDPENALLPNWRHLPVGYHGRASTIVVSGTDIIRPVGQKAPVEPGGQPGFGPSNLLDFELEMGYVIGRDTRMGDRVDVDTAEQYVLGLILFNDWSARDIQKWEYVPLGPFLGKNFASTVAPWIIDLDALEPFRADPPQQDPDVLDYLIESGSTNYDIHLEAWIKTAEGVEQRLCATNYKYMYWSLAQQLAHHTVGGCSIRVGDIYASGTISGPTADSYGSMLELSWRGSKPIVLSDGSQRTFLQDGDTLTLRGWAQSEEGYRVGFGTCAGRIHPAHEAV